MPSVPFEIHGLKFTLPAAADLSTHQYKGVICDASGDAALAGAGAAIVGVLQNKPDTAGKAAEIMANGISKMTSGAAVTQGAAVMCDADGEAIDHTATNVPIGIALTGSAGADEVISVLLSQQVTIA